jgi:hypothetical protein
MVSGGEYIVDMHFSEPFAPVAAGVLVVATLIGGAVGVLTASTPPSDADASSSLVAGLPSLRDGKADPARYRYSLNAESRLQPIDAASSSSTEAFGGCGDGFSGSGWTTAETWQAAAALPPPASRARRYRRSSGTFAQSNYRFGR